VCHQLRSDCFWKDSHDDGIFERTGYYTFGN
jgi:hypothetical protein